MKTYLVGGAVRDLLLGRMPKDCDYAFDDKAEAFIQAKPGSCKVGRSVSVLILNGVEYTPLAGASLDSDLLSRDLTINSLALGKDGRIYMHPQAIEDLRTACLRLAAPTALEHDPLRVFRIARFAAHLPQYSIDSACYELMRKTAEQKLLDKLPAERVGREMLKAFEAPQPSRFIYTLAKAGCLLPWFAECEDMDDIPAGPAQFHRGSVLQHTCRIMDSVQGDSLAVWMALTHDLGKISTDAAILPHHYGHERRGKPLAERLAKRLALPKRFERGGMLAAELHMQAGIYPELRIGTKHDLLIRVHYAGFDTAFWKLADTDAGQNRSEQAMRDLHTILAVKLPPDWQGQGKESGERLRLLQCEALHRMRD